MEEENEKLVNPEEEAKHIRGLKMISVNVPVDWVIKRRNIGYNWRYLIEMGFKAHENETEIRLLKEEIAEIEKLYKKLEETAQTRGVRLSRYIEKYGIDEEIMYKL